jgi:hypothetical protein
MTTIVIGEQQHIVCVCFGVLPPPPCDWEPWNMIIQKLHIVASLQTRSQHIHRQYKHRHSFFNIFLIQSNVTLDTNDYSCLTNSNDERMKMLNS